MKVQHVNTIKPITPEVPVSPVRNMLNSKKKIVHYMDGTNNPKELNELRKQIKENEEELYLYYCQDWSNGQGYNITDNETVWSGKYIITDRDILKNVKRKDGIKSIDGDDIFNRYDMDYREFIKIRRESPRL